MAEDQETFDASDAAALSNANRDAARIAREDADVLRTLMRAKEGRAFVYRHLLFCHIFGAGRTEGTTFVPGQPDVTAFQLGQENAGKRLMVQIMDASTDLYLRMIKDQQEEDARLNEVRRKEAKNRAEAEGDTTESNPFPDLPPPAGFPGAPPLPKTKKQGNAKK